MRKVLSTSALGLAAWLAIAIGWSVASLVTGIPGPARTATASIEVAAEVVEAPDLPPPLAAPQRALGRQLHRSTRMIDAVYRGPRRVAGRLLERLDIPVRSWELAHRAEPCEAPKPAAEASREALDQAQLRLEAAMERVDARMETVHRHLEQRREEMEARRSEMETRLEERPRQRATVRLRTRMDIGQSLARLLTLTRLDVDGTRIEIELPDLERVVGTEVVRIVN